MKESIYFIYFLLEASKENIFSWYILLMHEAKRTMHQLPTRDYNTIIQTSIMMVHIHNAIPSRRGKVLPPKTCSINSHKLHTFTVLSNTHNMQSLRCLFKGKVRVWHSFHYSSVTPTLLLHVHAALSIKLHDFKVFIACSCRAI